MGLAAINTNFPPSVRKSDEGLSRVIKMQKNIISGIRKARSREASQRDKVLLTVLSGGLILVGNFALDISEGEFIRIHLLTGGIKLLALGLVSILVAYLTVDFHFIGMESAVRKIQAREENCWTYTTELLNIFSLLFAITGIISLALFALRNID